MSLSQSTSPRKRGPIGPVRHFHLKTAPGAAGEEFVPFFYLEAKIDLADVRSGVRESLSVTRALEIVQLEGDALWTEDMVRTVDPAFVEGGLPGSPALNSLPSHVDAIYLQRVESQFLRYLLRHFEVHVFRNPYLRHYSLPGESKDDFTARCLEMLARSFRNELDGIRELCDRKLERVRLKYLKPGRVEGFAEERISAEARNRIHEMAERVEELFVTAELTAEPSGGDPMFPGTADGTLEQRLASIECEARDAIRRLAIEYTEMAGNLDEYLVRPSLRDIRLGHASILWMPVRVTA
jgi:hypothetical protein